MKVLKDYVLVEEPKLEEKKSEGGIILSQDKVDYITPVTQKVTCVGKDVQEIKVGDEILYLPRSGVEVKRQDVTWRLLKEDEVIAVM